MCPRSGGSERQRFLGKPWVLGLAFLIILMIIFSTVVSALGLSGNLNRGSPNKQTVSAQKSITKEVSPSIIQTSPAIPPATTVLEPSGEESIATSIPPVTVTLRRASSTTSLTETAQIITSNKDPTPKQTLVKPPEPPTPAPARTLPLVEVRGVAFGTVDSNPNASPLIERDKDSESRLDRTATMICERHASLKPIDDQHYRDFSGYLQGFCSALAKTGTDTCLLKQYYDASKSYCEKAAPLISKMKDLLEQGYSPRKELDEVVMMTSTLCFLIPSPGSEPHRVLQDQLQKCKRNGLRSEMRALMFHSTSRAGV